MGPWLDDVARELARGQSRRAALGRLGGGLAAVLLGARLPRPVAAQASCPTGQTDCGNGCKDLDFDRRNCGACGLSCGRNFHCTLGTCLCDAGFCPSGGVCVRPTRDPDNCGTCFHVCPRVPNATSFCKSGRCNFRCNTGFGNCNQVTNDGCEVDLRTDPANCGRCGRACRPGEGCDGGRCKPGTCTDGARNGQETDVDCGGPTCPKCADGKLCSVNADCRSGLCDPATQACIACDAGHGCPSGQCCSGGACVTSCPSGRCCDSRFNPGRPTCVNAADCPNDGCCSGGVCAVGRSDTECGTGSACFSCEQSPLGRACRDGRCGCSFDSDCNAGDRCDPGLRICVACSPNLPCPGSQCCENNARCVSACLAGFCCSNGACVQSCPAGQCCPVGGGPCVETCPGSQCCDGGLCVTANNCRPGRFCASGVCIECDDTHPCPSGEACQDGFCVACSPGSRPAGAICCEPGTIPCGTACCPQGQTCVGNVCSCPQGGTLCRDTSGDEDLCCNAAAGEVCCHSDRGAAMCCNPESFFCIEGLRVNFCCPNGNACGSDCCPPDHCVDGKCCTTVTVVDGNRRCAD